MLSKSIRKVITEEADGIHVHIEFSGKRFMIRFEVAGNSFNMNLSRMEYINLIGVLMEGKNLMEGK